MVKKKIDMKNVKVLNIFLFIFKRFIPRYTFKSPKTEKINLKRSSEYWDLLIIKLKDITGTMIAIEKSIIFFI